MNFFPVVNFCTLDCFKKLLDFLGRNNLTTDIFPFSIKRKLADLCNQIQSQTWNIQRLAVFHQSAGCKIFYNLAVHLVGLNRLKNFGTVFFLADFIIKNKVCFWVLVQKVLGFLELLVIVCSPFKSIAAAGNKIISCKTNNPVQGRHNFLHCIRGKRICLNILNLNLSFIALFKFIIIAGNGKHVVHKPEGRNNADCLTSIFTGAYKSKRIRNIKFVLIASLRNKNKGSKTTVVFKV